MDHYILHFSDLHFGELSVKEDAIVPEQFHDFYRSLTDKINEIIKKHSPRLIIISGDIGSKGKVTRDTYLIKFFKLFSNKGIPILLCVGNHDLDETVKDFVRYSEYTKLINEINDSILNTKLSKDFNENQASYIFIEEINSIFFSINSTVSNKYIEIGKHNVTGKPIYDSNLSDSGLFSIDQLVNFLEEIRGVLKEKFDDVDKFLVTHYSIDKFKRSKEHIRYLEKHNVKVIFSGHEHNYDYFPYKTLHNFVAGSILVKYKHRLSYDLSVSNPLQFNLYKLDTNQKNIQYWVISKDPIEADWKLKEQGSINYSLHPKKEIESSEDNYDTIMSINEKKSEYFRILKTGGTRSVIYHIDIEDKKVIPIRELTSHVEDLLFNKNEWVLISGGSGFSKTTTAKIVAFNLKTNASSKDKIYIRFAETSTEIHEFLEFIEKTDEKWLLILDDLHRKEFGELKERLSSITEFINKKYQLHILSLSRVSKKGLFKLCGNDSKCQQIINCFREVKCEDFQNEIDKTKEELVKNFLKSEKEVPLPLINDISSKILSRFGQDFVTIAFALWGIEPKIEDFQAEQILLGLKKVILQELNEAKERISSYNITERTFLRCYIGVCYEALFDELITLNHFEFAENSSDQNKDKRNDIFITLESLIDQGLLYEKIIPVEPNSKTFHTVYGLKHAEIAEIHLKALQITEEFLDGSYKWSNLSTLRHFEAHIIKDFDFDYFFKNFTNLISLDLSHMQIKHLPESISNLKSLTKLNLSDCYLESLPKSLGDLQSLQVLSLIRNFYLNHLPESICNLKLLKILQLSFTNISCLPKLFGNLQSLEKLLLTRCQLKTLPNSFGDLKSLKDLALDNNGLETIPSSFGNLDSLESLDLKNNNLETLPNSFGTLISLKWLNLSLNQFKNLPEFFCELKKLEILYLSLNTKLESLPKSFGKLENLQQLYISEIYGLKNLPDSFGNLKSLQRLQIMDTSLERLPESICNLQSLKKINLSKNKSLIISKTIKTFFENIIKNGGEVIFPESSENFLQE